MTFSTLLAVIESDKDVGDNVRALRGATSQQDLADQMRERGWNWAQATVWSLEIGKRPLRLLEAQDLADVLGVSLEDLLRPPESAQREREILRAADAVIQAHLNAEVALGELIAAGDEFRRMLLDAPDPLQGYPTEEVHGALERTVDDLLESMSAELDAERERRTRDIDTLMERIERGGEYQEAT